MLKNWYIYIPIVFLLPSIIRSVVVTLVYRTNNSLGLQFSVLQRICLISLFCI